MYVNEGGEEGHKEAEAVAGQQQQQQRSTQAPAPLCMHKGGHGC